jgi:Tol biopolymer transport system component
MRLPGARASPASGRPQGPPQRLTTGLGAISISMSADGRRLAYAVYTARANIWALPIPAGEPVSAETATAVTSGNQVIEAMRVSRDGQWLVYDTDLRGNADNYRIPVAGGPPEQLTTDPADEFAGDLSPDGQAIVYHSWRSGSRDIEVKPLDGRPVQAVTDTPSQESYPVWSPDGSAIMFVDQADPSTIKITRREPEGRWQSPPRVLVSPAVSAEWSPDGARVALVGSSAFLNAGPVMVVPAAGGVSRQLFAPDASAPAAAQVAWSTDGRTIFYKAHDAEGRTSFWAVHPEGGSPRLLVHFPNPDRQSYRKDFAVNGQRLYFTIEDRQSDVVLADLVTR